MWRCSFAQLAEPLPYDLDEADLSQYKGLSPKWHDWPAVLESCEDISARMLGSRSSHLP
jgi:hypothetical protein